MVSAAGASNPYAAASAARPAAPAAGKSAADKLASPDQPTSAADQIAQAGGCYEWQTKVKREKLEAMIRQQVEREFAGQDTSTPEGRQALQSRIAEEIAKRLREAIEREAKTDAEAGRAQGAIIDIAV